MLLFRKYKKFPVYWKSLRKHAKQVGWFSVLKELVNYNRFYFRLLKRNGNKAGIKEILYHTAFYTKVVSLFPEITTDQLIKVVPRSITHGIYQKLKIDRTSITYDKYLLYTRLENLKLPIPEIYLVTDENCNPVENIFSFDELKGQSKKKRILVKPRFSNGGVGIHLLKPNEEILPNHIYQDFIFNHSDFQRIQGSDYCGTIRFVVYNKAEGEIDPVSASVQFNGGTITDHMINGGSVSGLLNLGSGEVMDYCIDKNGTKYEKNPFSHEQMKGFKIPFWSELLGLVKKTCAEYQELPLIAFDIAITENGPVILELNAGCGTIAAQFNHGWLNHAFVRDFYKIR